MPRPHPVVALPQFEVPVLVSSCRFIRRRLRRIVDLREAEFGLNNDYSEMVNLHSPAFAV